MTVLDYILLAALLLVLPAEALWNTVARRDKPPRALGSRLLRSLRVIAVLLALLVAIWWRDERPAAWLGLDAPISTAGLMGLAFAVALVSALIFASVSRKPNARDIDAAAVSGMMPSTQSETRLFILFGVAAGVGWELLYRGFLLWALTPWIGMVGAVIVAAIAYALGHGSRDTKSLIGSVISSFLFTIGFAATGSLWWLILIHAALPLIGLLAMRSLQPART